MTPKSRDNTESEMSTIKQNIVCHIWHTYYHYHLYRSCPHYNLFSVTAGFTTTTTSTKKYSIESHHTFDTLIGQVSAYADVTSSGIIPFSRFLNWSGYLQTGQFASLMDSSYYYGHFCIDQCQERLVTAKREHQVNDRQKEGLLDGLLINIHK